MKVIGIGGYARSGKDTFVSIAKQILTKNNYRPIQAAFATELKKEVQDMLGKNDFLLDVYTNDTEAKKKIRPLLVWWGCARRDLSEGGLYWVDRVDEYLSTIKYDAIKNGEDDDRIVAMVSDVRFPNEAQWIHDKWNGTFIHLKRFSVKDCRDGYGDTVQGKFFDDAPNEEEAKNDPLIQKMADVKIEWQSRGIPAGGDVTQDQYLQDIVLEALNNTPIFKHKTIGTLSL